ncbi:MAG TPA: TA system VapC family ribonuclease toxin, partial [Terriglobales bacterium]|nr:TA system VapC family ribonuclease toxin [Terriglobales bacterium]
MIAVDTNLLLYAHRSDSEWHDRAGDLVRSLAQARASWAIPWPCVHEFLAIATHPRVYDPPTPLAVALAQVEAWMESPGLQLLGDGGDHWATLRPLVEAGRIVGPKVHDARIAALCLAHGVQELWTADRDFSRFPALRAINPLTTS